MWILALPFALATSALVCAVTVTGLVWGLPRRLVTKHAETPTVIPLARASFVLPLCTNVITTALILSRIWWVGRAVGSRSTTRRAIHVIIESGALYFLVQLILVILYGIHSGGATIMISIAVQVYGIASTLIIIHVGLRVSSEQPATSTSFPQMQFSTVGVANRTALGSPAETFELRVRRPSSAHHEASFDPTRGGSDQRIVADEEVSIEANADYKKTE
ncbi:hypothetical protein PsYK624_015620 [Phanerochaete sordida]|uniref:Uncharacterized protein n=1 Tax=Phanerochaete sordida TaxID=48140 RepID=A0A9P3L8Z0_9APHY|nr:hypothetical protein PsYK624_015620 [Phanerochaete sordida]